MSIKKKKIYQKRENANKEKREKGRQGIKLIKEKTSGNKLLDLAREIVRKYSFFKENGKRSDSWHHRF